MLFLGLKKHLQPLILGKAYIYGFGVFYLLFRPAPFRLLHTQSVPDFYFQGNKKIQKNTENTNSGKKIKLISVDTAAVNGFDF